MCAKFQFNKQQLSIQKKYDQGSFTLNPCQQLQCQYTAVGIKLIELTEPSGVLMNLIVSHFLNNAFYKLFCTYFCFLHLCGKSFCYKTGPVFYISFLILVWGGIQCYSIKGSLFGISDSLFIRLQGLRYSLATADIMGWKQQ